MPRFSLIVVLGWISACWAAPPSPTAPRTTAPTWAVPAAWPRTHSLNAVHGTALSNLYAVGDRGTVLHSTNAGESWTQIESHTALFFRGVWVGEAGVFAVANLLNDDLPRAVILRFGAGRSMHRFDDVQFEAVWGSGAAIFAVGTRIVTEADVDQRFGVIARSLDGGQTWTSRQIGAGGAIAIGGTGTMMHVLTTDGWLATSSDRGETYTFTQLPVADEYEALDVAPGRLLAASANRHIVRSTDGGVSWNEIRSSSDGHVWSAGEVVFAFHNGGLDQSRDGGTTWTRQTTHEIVAAVWGTPEGFVAVGQAGLVSTSRDGTVWERRDRGVVGALSDISGSSDDVFIVGDDRGRGGVIVHATEGGTKFDLRREGWPALRGVWSGGLDFVVVVGDRGTILRSHDRGIAWRRVASGTAETLLAVGGCDARELYAVGDHGVILYSRDRGAHWTPVGFGEPNARLTDVTCVDGVVHAAGPIDVLRLGAGRATRIGPRPTAAERQRSSWQTIGNVWGRGGEQWWLTHDQLRRRKDGGPWQIVPTRTKVHTAAWDTGETLWLGGWSGALVAITRAGGEREHWSGVDSSFRAIWGVAGGRTIWAVGGGGTLVRIADHAR